MIASTTKKLSFIEEAKQKGYEYLSNGILGNGFYGKMRFVSLSEMGKYSRFLYSEEAEFILPRAGDIDVDFIVDNSQRDTFTTGDVLKVFPNLQAHTLHNFLNKNKDCYFLKDSKRLFSKENIQYIYQNLINKDYLKNNKLKKKFKHKFN